MGLVASRILDEVQAGERVRDEVVDARELLEDREVRIGKLFGRDGRLISCEDHFAIAVQVGDSPDLFQLAVVQPFLMSRKVIGEVDDDSLALTYDADVDATEPVQQLSARR